MRIRIDRALERSLVAFPALANVNSDDSEDLNANNAGMKTKNSNDSKDDRKISLSGYYPVKRTHRQIVENHGARNEKCKSRDKGKKMSLHRERTSVYRVQYAPRKK